MRQTASERLACDLLRSFVRDKMQAGDRVPSVKRIAEDYRVCAATAHAAVRYLAGLKVVVAQGTRGTIYCGAETARNALADIAMRSVVDGVRDLNLAGIGRDEVTRKVNGAFSGVV